MNWPRHANGATEGGSAGPGAIGPGAPGRDRLEARQFDSLRRLVEAVGAANAFYRGLWSRAGIGEAPSFRELGDFRMRFPFTWKRELVADQAEHPPYGTNLTFPLERYTRCHGTSGSTGRPLRWLDTPESWDWMLGNWGRVYEVAGVERGDRVFFAFSFGPFLGFWTAFEAAQRLGCLVLPGGGLTSVARLHALLEQRVTVLCCTPTYALHLVEVARSEGLDLGAAAVRRILVAGEPGGSVPATRRAIEAGWPRARVVDHHGMTEVGPVSYQCAAAPGVLHVIEDSYLAEIVEPRTGQPMGPGQAGELVLTTLGRTGSPLIRYRTGDLVRGRTAGCCACGTWDLALEGGIIGRTDDMVVIRGVNVFPSAVDDILRQVEGVGEYRAEVHAAGALLELRIEVEPGVGRDAVDIPSLGRAVESALQTRLALRVPVRVVEPGTLPRFEMKARRWVRTATPSGPPAAGGSGAAGVR